MNLLKVYNCKREVDYVMAGCIFVQAVAFWELDHDRNGDMLMIRIICLRKRMRISPFEQRNKNITQQNHG
jgi:hypothetical protein